MTLVVSKLPGRKRPALCMESGSVITPLAYFVNDAAMRLFLEHKPLANVEPVSSDG